MIDLETKDIKKLEWKNTDMVGFYENIPVEILRGYAKMGGFEDGCDIDLVYPYIAHTQSLIEAGAAYGRVIENLLRKKYTGKIYAIERSKNFCNYLKEHYQEKVEIINADIMNFEPLKKVDVVLWMWSNIAEFPKNDQLIVLKHLASFLNSEGFLIVDIMPHDILSINLSYSKDNQTYQEDSPYGVLYGYAPSTKEIHLYAESIGFTNIHSINYKTSANRPRVLHILSGLKLI